VKRKAGRADGKPLIATLSSQHSPLKLPGARYLFFGGKGGVGKTTAASAAALYLLEHATSTERLLLFSTDPAHSLSDSLGIQIGDAPVEVARRRGARLIAYEMDAALALEKFKAQHSATLSEIAERGTFLDESDIKQFLDLSLPGMDEVMALFELSELDRNGLYTRIVIDTAPSGHTSRLLRLPEVFAHMVAALDRMADKHRYIVARFARGGRVREDEVDLFLRDLSERIERVRDLLYDKNETAFTLVTIPEAMAFEETVRYFAQLNDEGIPVTDLIVNRVEREHGDCGYCRARVKSQKAWLKSISREFNSLRQHHVPLLSHEVRGVEALRTFARIVWEGARDAWEPDEERHTVSSSPPMRLAASHFSIESRRLHIFGGKGGVGKTTAAASVALALAREKPRERVLVFSTDPAHSLSDSFGEPVGALKKGVAGQKNLDAIEIDPAERFKELKSRYQAWTDQLFQSLTGGSRWEVQFDREAMRELVALAPPGIDEIAALSTVSDLLEKGSYTSIILDTAPTGHLLRFLELPEIALSWVRAFIKLLLKYQNVVRASGIAEELIALSKSIKRVAALLTDVEQCEFIGVAIPEHMSLEETLRLKARLLKLEVPMSRLLINNVLPPEAAAACDFCAERRRAQEPVIEEYQKRLKGVSAIFIAPQQPHEIQGAESLKEHFSEWRQLESQDARKELRHSAKSFVRAGGATARRRSKGQGRG
jgi:arsenite-transporting ATPase